MDYFHLSDNAARQLIDSTTLFNEVLRVEAQARPYIGGMYWKREGDYEYLVKTRSICYWLQYVEHRWLHYGGQ